MKKAVNLRLAITVFLLTLLPTLANALTAGQVFDKVQGSIVVVQTLDSRGDVISQGSGVLLPSGKIATNRHVVEKGAAYKVGVAGRFVPATLYAEDFDKDICLLDAKGLDRNPVELGKASTLKVGDRVYAVGAPRGLELSLSDGIVSQLRGGPPPLIQTTAAISPGSSGGGLFDGEGRLVGLTTLYIEGGQSLNFAMPVEWIDEVKPGRKVVTGDHGKSEWWMRAAALEELDDWQGLRDWCLKWTKSEPGNAIAWAGLGYAYGELNRYNEAIDACRQAIRIDPEDAMVWHSLGNVYLIQNRYYDSIEAYRKAIRIDPEKDKVWFNLGCTYAKINRYNDAIDALREALRINPEDAQTWQTLGAVYALSGNRGAALDAVRELRRLDPVKADELFDDLVPKSQPQPHTSPGVSATGCFISTLHGEEDGS